jgi:short-subunit dehydrogenase
VELDQARVLLTGASGGIGQAIAHALHDRGATLLLSGRRADVLDQLASELGERAEVLPADLADSAAVRELAQRAAPVDVLVANAGLPGTGTLESFTPEEVDRVLDVNLRSPVHLTHTLVPGMRERGSGHLVFISSMSGKVATARASLYNATKFGLRGFAFALWEELQGSGVGVTTIFPGPISDAGMWADAGLKRTRGMSTHTPSEVADAVIRGIERGKVEIDVAPMVHRLGGWLAGPTPGLVSAIMRRMGSDEVAERLADAQRSKR